MHSIQTRKIFFTPKGIILLIFNFNFCRCNFQTFFRMNRDVSSAKIPEVDFRVPIGFLSRIFPKHKPSCLYFAMIQEIPQPAGKQVRSKLKSSGLELEANVDFRL